MGLGNWLEDKADSRTVKMCKASLEEFAKRCDANPAFLSRSAELLANAMRELWPHPSSDPVEYVLAVRGEFDRMLPGQIFDTAYRMQRMAAALKKQGMSELSAPVGFLSEWVNVVSIARRKSSNQSIPAAQLARMYEAALMDLLSRA